MRYQLFFFFLVSTFFNFKVVAQTISNIDFFAEGKNVVVTYDLTGCEAGEVFDVNLSFIEQNTLKVIVPKAISGDRSMVNCGSKSIVWDIGADMSTLAGSFYPELELVRVKSYQKQIEKTSLEIEFVNIPAGTFLMGSHQSEVNRMPDEKQHQVTLSAFRISKNEITFSQYDAFCDATGRAKPDDQGWGRGNRPVINVSWIDANAFAEWKGGRLPTEAEWEYACRAGTITPFYTGKNLSSHRANYDASPIGGYLQKTQVVGSYQSNAWGVNDMHGNVWEWCSDWYGDYSSGNQKNPKGPIWGSTRVYRGGSWSNYERICRSANRQHDKPTYKNFYIGFRIVDL